MGHIYPSKNDQCVAILAQVLALYCNVFIVQYSLLYRSNNIDYYRCMYIVLLLRLLLLDYCGSFRRRVTGRGLVLFLHNGEKKGKKYSIGSGARTTTGASPSAEGGGLRRRQRFWGAY